ncbi:MAG TPA: hypothetical protein PLJ47_00090 [Candidatus Hydrogenedentes bacterium]|nr:hypothetical protein [Candidatus Hydrogenedentota bacterium]
MALSGTASGCINHPGVESVGRCKQCGTPFCNACKVQGPTGFFCSAVCKEKHEVFVKRAQELDTRKGRLGIGYFLGRIMGFAVALLVIAILLGVVGVVFQVPVLSPFVANVRNSIGI